MPTDIEQVWREKSDDDLIEAAGQLDDYTAEGQRVIRSELKRRGLEDPLEQAGETSVADESGPPLRECTQCHAPLRYLSFEEDEPGLGPLQALRRIFEDQPLDVCICPECGHVDLFINVEAAGLDAPTREDEQT